MGRKPQVPMVKARARGAPILSPAILVVARPSISRTGYLHRQVLLEWKKKRTVLIVDFCRREGELLTGMLPVGRSALAEVDSREGIFPLAGLRALPAEAREAAGEIFAGWLRPVGHFAESRDMNALLELFSRLPVLLPHSSLYTWRRYMVDRGFRRECIRGLRRQGVDPSALLNARPGTALWRVLSERVSRVLGHDDTLDRVFPIADPSRLVEPARVPELRIIQSQVPWTSGAKRYPTLLWLHLLAALSALPGRRINGGSQVGRLVLVDPPESAWRTASLLAPVARAGLRITVVTAEREPIASPEGWFGRVPAVVVQRSLGPERLASWGLLDGSDSRRLHTRHTSSKLLFVHQLGAPVERWCAFESYHRLPGADPAALQAARSEGRRRYIVSRHKVLHNRRRIEDHARRAARRGATRDLLERATAIGRLTDAWRRIFRSKGCAGADRVTVDGFAERWQQHLAALQAAVRADRYRPKPYLRIWREKASGDQRPLAIPSVLDRVLMRAAADVLSSVLEPYFSDSSFAYRPGRGAQRAITQLMSSPRLSTGWALVTDIASYFDNINHRLLLAMLREKVADDAFVRIVAAWITNPTIESGRETRPRRGVPQGAPISPVLSNLFLTPLDRRMDSQSLDYVRYADDFVALCDSESQATQASADLEAFLSRDLKLSVKPTKAQFVSMRDGFDFLGFSLGSAGVWIPGQKLSDARLAVRQILGRDDAVTGVLDRLDSYVRGFRNYFDIGTPLITEALAALEADRRSQIAAWAKAQHVDPSIVLGRSERFIVDATPASVPGAYGEKEQRAKDEDDELPGWVSGPTTSLAAVDRRPAAVRARAAGPRPVAVNAGGHLGIFGFGVIAGLEEERLVMHRKRKLVFEIPVAAIRTVLVDSYGIVVTTPLLEKLSELDIPVLFARHGARPWAVLRPLASRGSVDLLRAQIAAQGDPIAVAIAQELIGAKLTNQERLLRYFAKYKRRRTAPSGVRLREGASLIVKLVGELTGVASDDLAAARRKVFSIEGRAGAIYWSALREVLGESFRGRTGRGARDPINVAINYGYGILYAATWGAVGRAGLDPGIGMLHASTGNRGAMVFDLIEPFRVPAVDRPVASLVSRSKQIRVNKDGDLTARARRTIAMAVGRALERKTPWAGTTRPLGAHIEHHAKALAIWLHGRKPFRALRIRW